MTDEQTEALCQAISHALSSKNADSLEHIASALDRIADAIQEVADTMQDADS